MISTDTALFYLLGSLALLCSVMVVTTRNPVHSVLYLILTFCNATALLVLLEVEFLALIFLVVYVGAIAVLFLFVVIILNINIVEISSRLLGYLPIGILVSVLFVTEIALVIDQSIEPAPLNANRSIP